MSPTNIEVAVYDKALRVPLQVLDALGLNEPNANCILPILLKSRHFESSGQKPPRKQMWVVCSSKNCDGQTVIEFILSITEGYIDSYPVFFYTTLPIHQLTQEFVLPRIKEMIGALLSSGVPVERIYAVYGPDCLAKAFAWNWTNMTGTRNLGNEPYYAAKLSFCSRRTFKERTVEMRDGVTYEIRPANNSDIGEIARCCYGFAEDSVGLSVIASIF